MATSTQRLLMIVIAINLLMSVAFAVYEAPRTVDYTLFGETIDLGETTAGSLESEGQGGSPEHLQEEGSIGNVIRMGGLLINLFFRGLVGIPMNTAGLGQGIESLAFLSLLLFKSLMYMLLTYEAYAFFKNKKNT